MPEANWNENWWDLGTPTLVDRFPVEIQRAPMTESMPLNVGRHDDGTFWMSPRVLAEALEQERRFLEALASPYEPEAELRAWEAAFDLLPYTVLDRNSPTFELDAFMRGMVDGEIWVWGGGGLGRLIQQRHYERGLDYVVNESYQAQRTSRFDCSVYGLLCVPAFPVETLAIIQVGNRPFRSGRVNLIDALALRLGIPSQILDQCPVTDSLELDQVGRVGARGSPTPRWSVRVGDLARAAGMWIPEPGSPYGLGPPEAYWVDDGFWDQAEFWYAGVLEKSSSAELFQPVWHVALRNLAQICAIPLDLYYAFGKNYPAMANSLPRGTRSCQT